MLTQQGVDDSHVVVGKVSKAQGLAGEVKIVHFTGQANELFSYQSLLVENKNGECQSLSVEYWRLQGNFAIAKFREITDRDGAERLVGAEISVLRSQMPPLTPDEFYWHEIVGMRVVTDQGQELGDVTSLIATGANDVMVVTGRGHEYLIPLIQELIVTQDNQTKTLVIAPMDGLLDLNLSDAV